jgi:predicted ester cyclase
MSGSGVELVRRWVGEIMSEGRLDSVADVVAADFVEHATATFGSTSPGRVDGHAHTRQVVAMLHGQFPDIHMSIEAIAEDGDTVAVLVTATGTNSGSVGMMPATGRQFRAGQSHWFRVVDGRLAEHWATRDDLTTVIQLGLVTPPAPRQA